MRIKKNRSNKNSSFSERVDKLQRFTLKLISRLNKKKANIADEKKLFSLVCSNEEFMSIFLMSAYEADEVNRYNNLKVLVARFIHYAKELPRDQRIHFLIRLESNLSRTLPSAPLGIALQPWRSDPMMQACKGYAEARNELQGE